MIKNDLKEKLGEDWRSKFAHRDCDQSNYEFGSFEVDGKKIWLVLNPNTLDIMDFYYDDLADDEWIEVDKKTLVSLSKLFLKKDLDKNKLYINREYFIKVNNKDKKQLSDELVDRCPYPITSFLGIQLKTHRLIAKVFIPNPDPERFKIVNHKDKTRTNFRIENLEWCDEKWNSKRENQKEYLSGKLYERLIDNKRFTSKELDKEYDRKGVSSAILSSIQQNYTYHGSFWKVVDVELELYTRKHPITDIWYKHPVINNLEVNSSGVLRVNNKITVGSINRDNLFYKISVNSKTYKTHRLIAEAKLGRELLEDEVVDHIIPVSKDDINNEIINLRVCSKKDNLNNPTTKEKQIKTKNIRKFSLDGREIERFDNLDSIINKYPNLSKNLIFKATKRNQGLLTYKNFIWCSGDNFKNELEEKLNFIFYKFKVDDNSDIIIIKSSSNINKLKENTNSLSFKKLINTGVPDEDGFFYQQGDIKHPIVDKENTNLIKKRNLLKSWRSYSNRSMKK